MKKVLYAWEFGGGSGHLHKLSTLAAALRDRGFEAVVASRDLKTAERICTPLALPFVQAPVWPGRIRQDAAPRTFPEILMELGFNDPEFIAGLIRAWRELLRVTGCDALVADYSPIAVLSARLAGVTTLAFGTGFTLPPAQTPFRPIVLRKNTKEGELAKIEARVLRNTNQAIRALGYPPLERLADMLACDKRYLATFPELDHFGRRKGVEYWGVFDTGSNAVAPTWPKIDARRLFVYYHPHYEHFRALIDALSKLGWSTLVAAPGITPRLARSLVKPNVNICARPVDLPQVGREANVAVCHGGHGAVAELLRCGCRVVIFPYYNEQKILGVRLDHHGLARIAQSAQACAEAVGDIDDDTSLAENVERFAGRYGEWTAEKRLDAIVDDMITRLRRTVH